MCPHCDDQFGPPENCAESFFTVTGNFIRHVRNVHADEGMALRLERHLLDPPRPGDRKAN